MKKRIAIIDYDMGNLRSVEKALDFVGAESIITSDPQEIMDSMAAILPGVGAFPDAIEIINDRKLDEVVKKFVDEGRPLLGICLGMQLLFDESDEGKRTEGLRILPGKIKKFEIDLKVPQIGWNSLKIDGECEVLKDTSEDSYVYFVHSHYVELENNNLLNAHCEYEVNVPAIVSRDNVIGIQFHPEKSGDVGLKMLGNFWRMIG